MKKILVTLFVLISFTTVGFASNLQDYEAFHKLNNKNVFTSLVGYINADPEQVSYLREVFQVTDNELNKAEKNQNEKFAETVVDYNLYNSKCILTDDQYKKYLTFINYYLKNDNLLSINK